MKRIATTTAARWATAKKATWASLLVLGLMLFAAAVPAFAQQQGPVTATDVLQRAAPDSPGPTPVYAVTDEATGTPYRLISGFVNLEYYVGQRITFQGVPVPGLGTPDAPRELNATQVEPAADPPVSHPDTTATLAFENAVCARPMIYATSPAVRGTRLEAQPAV